jgi:predicted nucleotidyltransferase
MRATQPGQSALLLLDAVALLKTATIDYAVIGAMAASVHGVVRASLDADAIMSLTTQKLDALEDVFKAAGFKTELRRGDPEDPIPALLTVSDAHGNRVDLLAGLRGMAPEAFRRAIEVPFQGERLRVVGREDFIAMKLFAGGPQDLLDARRAMAVSKGSLDMSLLLRVAKGFGHQAVQSLQSIL